MRRFHRLSAALIGALAGCTVAETSPPAADTAGSAGISDGLTDSARLVVVPANPSDTSAVTSPVGSGVATWTISEKGFGPVQAGMTIVQADAALGGILSIPARPAECDYVRPRTGLRHIAFMVENGRIARVDVLDSSSVATAAGARIGDTEARIRSLYSGRVTVTPHKYTDGRYLTVTPLNPADSAFRVVFETNGTKVVRYRSGVRPAVEYVEGCS